MRKYSFWWFLTGSDQYHIVPLSLVIFDQSNLPPWTFRTIWESHLININPFSFHNILMIGMPFHTKHHTCAPTSPMLLRYKSKFVRLEFCCNAPARAWQETNDLIEFDKHTEAHSIHVPQTCKMCSRLRVFFKVANTITYWQENNPFLDS